MSELFARIKDDVKTAMRARDTERLSTLRMLQSTIKNQEIDLKRPLTDDEITDVLATEIKKRRQSAEVYESGGRPELAEKELEEIKVLQDYLPAQLSDEEAATIVADAIAEVGAESRKDMGKVMGVVIPKLKGVYDTSKVKDLVLAKLG
ncbi:GatB/YqeY domain-containing protein [Lujinxingia sediminis]|uniref:GatB/YqeY domain-containing protein n=1 Tax=Lujinxingia sediminis TaxID=2480984 RepID=A0ABY0CV51_9DELT|nr:GatB/YqeY domain-containing protein [Lujinxingia sediminis]RVU46942.1 GatB/YqeY domain-containing protein [Lujinxingia sediminis]